MSVRGMRISKGDTVSPAGDVASPVGDLLASPNFGICDTTLTDENRSKWLQLYCRDTVYSYFNLVA